MTTNITLNDIVDWATPPSAEPYIDINRVADTENEALLSAYAPMFRGQYSSDSPAFCYGENKLTFGELQDLSARSAQIFQSLRSLGNFEEGNCLKRATHRVIIAVPVCPALCGMLVGGLGAGSLLVYLDPDTPVARWREILEDFEPHAVIADHKTAQRMSSIKGDTGPGFVLLNLGDSEDLISVITATPACNRLPPFEPERPALVIYTSGSTGKPKGVVLTHGNMSENAPCFDRSIPMYATDRAICLGSWNNAPLVFVFAVFRVGACMHYMAERISRFPQAVAGYLEKEEITFFSAPASYHSRLLKYGSLGQRNLSLRAVEFWGESVYTSQVKNALQVLPDVDIIASYCCSEALCSNNSHINVHNVQSQGETISVKAVDGINARIVCIGNDPATRRFGQLEVTGNNVMLGYWHDIRNLPLERLQPAPRKFLFEDLVEQKPDNSLIVKGRIDSIVKIGGHRVSLTKVERELMQHPSIHAAVAMAAPGRSGMDRIVAAVMVEDSDTTEKSLMSHYRSRLQTQELPEKLVLFQSFPRTSSGKLDRMTIKSQIEKTIQGSDS